MSDREETLYKASLAMRANRFRDMAEIMRETALLKVELNRDERANLFIAYKRTFDRSYDQWNHLMMLEETDREIAIDKTHALIVNYREEVEQELTNICCEVLQLLREHLMPYAKAKDNIVYYYKSIGDYYRYLAEIENSKKVIHNSKSAYKMATDIAMRNLRPSHPVYLDLALNFAVFHYYILEDKDEAYWMVQKALENGTTDLALGTEKADEESVRLLKQLEGNMIDWSCESESDD